MKLRRIAAFSDGSAGGNPAGVYIDASLPDETEMRRVAAEVGYSETAFAAPMNGGWRVRYFSPEVEIPFCGHATIALGAALAMDHGDGIFRLALNAASITVEGRRDGDAYAASLQSPSTRSRAADAELVERALNLFGYVAGDLDTRIPPAIAEAGARHLVLALRTRELLAAMAYDLDAGRTLMADAAIITVTLIHARTPQRFDARNPFASGGVYEDPATGAAAAAFAGYLRDLDWPHDGAIEIVQGEDMGMRSRLRAEIPSATGSSIRVSGSARSI